MTISSGTFQPISQYDLAERRAILQRRRRRMRRREWLGVLCLGLTALWLASAALMALLAR